VAEYFIINSNTANLALWWREIVIEISVVSFNLKVGYFVARALNLIINFIRTSSVGIHRPMCGNDRQTKRKKRIYTRRWDYWANKLRL